MGVARRKKAERRNPGPEPDRIAFKGDPAAAIRNTLQKEPPPEARP